MRVILLTVMLTVSMLTFTGISWLAWGRPRRLTDKDLADMWAALPKLNDVLVYRQVRIAVRDVTPAVLTDESEGVLFEDSGFKEALRTYKRTQHQRAEA